MAGNVSARAGGERNTETRLRWRRRLLGRHWPWRAIYALSAAIVLLDSVLLVPVNNVILFPSKIVVVTASCWMAVDGMISVLRMSLAAPQTAPIWLQRVIRVWSYPTRWGAAAAIGLAALVPLVFVFPSLRGTPVAYAALVAMGLGLAPMLLLVVVVVLAIPVAVPIGTVRAIRNRRNRRYREIYRYMGRPPW